MNLKSNIIALQYLKNFNEELHEFKRTIIKEYVKEKFKKTELLFALEKLTEFENRVYKKFNHYLSTVQDTEIQILHKNFSNIRAQCQRFLGLYIKNYNIKKN
jgi:hypothetical protein